MSHKPASKILWQERDNGAYLAQQRALILPTYPDLEFKVIPEEQVALEGLIRLQAECGTQRALAVRIEFPKDYPQCEPYAFDPSHQFPHIADRHFYPDGRCCLWLPPESSWNGQDPEALLSFLHQVAIFFDKQLIYDVVRRWPGKQRSHGAQGYREWICEVLDIEERQLLRFAPLLLGWAKYGDTVPCPCGKNCKFRRCHRDQALTITSQVDVQTLRNALGQEVAYFRQRIAK